MRELLQYHHKDYWHRHRTKRFKRNSFPALSALCFFLTWLPYTEVVGGVLCESLFEETWDEFVGIMEASDGLAILCPFEISGSGCPSTPLGYVLSEHSSLTVLCQENMYGGYAFPVPTRTGCTINCPGNHFTVGTNASLTIDTLSLKGTQTAPSIYVGIRGEFQAFESTFENNKNPFGKGGAIHAGGYSRLLINHCEFTNNTSLNGGAIYLGGQSQIANSNFVGNIANSTEPSAGGGAVTIGSSSNVTITVSYFYENSAAGLGAAVLDLSDGSNTMIDSNYGCRNIGFGSNAIFCDGIERVDSTGQRVCLKFQETCLSTAEESSSSSPSEMFSPAYPIITPPPTNEPGSATSLPTNVPTPRPSSSPTSGAPTLDPCQVNSDSFECVLFGLIDQQLP